MFCCAQQSPTYTNPLSALTQTQSTHQHKHTYTRYRYSASVSGVTGGGQALPGSPLQGGQDAFRSLFRGSSTPGPDADDVNLGDNDEGGYDHHNNHDSFADTRGDLAGGGLGASPGGQGPELAAFSNEEERVVATYEGLVVTANLDLALHEADQGAISGKSVSVRLGLWSMAESAFGQDAPRSGGLFTQRGVWGMEESVNGDAVQTQHSHDAPNMSTIAEESQGTIDRQWLEIV